jgi:hypothetical protein
MSGSPDSEPPPPPLCKCGQALAIYPSKNPFACEDCWRDVEQYSRMIAQQDAMERAIKRLMAYERAQARGLVQPAGPPSPAPRPPPPEPPAAPGCPPRCSLKKWTCERLHAKLAEIIAKTGLKPTQAGFAAELDTRPTEKTLRGHFRHVGYAW